MALLKSLLEADGRSFDALTPEARQAYSYAMLGVLSQNQDVQVERDSLLSGDSDGRLYRDAVIKKVASFYEVFKKE